MTQKVVAQKAHMTQPAIARIERGDQSVSVDILGRVACVLGKELTLT